MFDVNAGFLPHPSKRPGVPSFPPSRASRQERAFCLTVAVLAAALADPCLEFASNAGWFGAGRFTDRGMADVLPTLLFGALFLVAQLLWIFRHACAHRRLDAPLRRPLAALLPRIFILQIAFLFVIESTEQRVVLGKFLGGTLWLGAPVPLALAVHALFATGIALLVATALREFARRAPALAAAVRSRFENAIPRATGTRRRFLTTFAAPPDVVFGATGERAPPIPVIA